MSGPLLVPGTVWGFTSLLALYFTPIPWSLLHVIKQSESDHEKTVSMGHSNPGTRLYNVTGMTSELAISINK